MEISHVLLLIGGIGLTVSAIATNVKWPIKKTNAMTNPIPQPKSIGEFDTAQLLHCWNTLSRFLASKNLPQKSSLEDVRAEIALELMPADKDDKNENSTLV